MTTEELRAFLGNAEDDDVVMLFGGDGNAIGSWLLTEIRDYGLAMLDVIEAARAVSEVEATGVLPDFEPLAAALARLKEMER